jgi:hypothetical protein
LHLNFRQPDGSLCARHDALAKGATAMDNESQRASIARHLRQLRRHLLPILDWMEKELGPPAPEEGMAYAIEAALGSQSSEEAEPLNDRHYWVLGQLAQDVKLTKRNVMEHFSYSERHAKRILSALTKRGLIEYCPLPRPGFYQLCDVEAFRQLIQSLDARDETTGADQGPRGFKPMAVQGTQPSARIAP